MTRQLLLPRLWYNSTVPQVETLSFSKFFITRCGSGCSQWTRGDSKGVTGSDCSRTLKPIAGQPLRAGIRDRIILAHHRRLQRLSALTLSRSCCCSWTLGLATPACTGVQRSFVFSGSRAYCSCGGGDNSFFFIEKLKKWLFSGVFYVTECKVLYKH